MPTPDPEPPRRLLAIEWGSIHLTTDAEALALWAKIAPTGADWSEKLDEVPGELDRALAIALLRAGNFTCVPAVPQRDCSVKIYDVPEPADMAGLTDPCLRRVLAQWAIRQLEPEDVPSVMDALRSIVALPPPEEQLIKLALDVIPEADPARRLELIGIAWRTGHRDQANSAVSDLDEAHLIEAVKQHHVDAALESLSAETHRAVFLTVVTDEQMASASRAQAITELAMTGDDKLAPDLRAALVKAGASKDCPVAAAAARALELRGDKKLVPKRARTADGMMRAICVLASYEQLQRSDERSLFPSFVPATGLERVEVAYDVLADVDTDGDGDPHTVRTSHLVPRAELVVPEIEDMVRAMRKCKGTTCTSDDREFKFAFKQAGGELVLHRLEIIERPPCQRP